MVCFSASVYDSGDNVYQWLTQVKIMELPVYIPYINAIYLVIAIGLGLTIFTSIGVFFKLWSWRVPRSMVYAFTAVVIAFIILSWLIGREG
jgi:hypothetical protein